MSCFVSYGPRGDAWPSGLVVAHEVTAPLLPSKIVYIGLRDVEQCEREHLRALDIAAYSMFDIERMGMMQVLDLAISHLDTEFIHLSFDIDSVDPRLAPSTGTPVPAGLTFREARLSR